MLGSLKKSFVSPRKSRRHSYRPVVPLGATKRPQLANSRSGLKSKVLEQITKKWIGEKGKSSKGLGFNKTFRGFNKSKNNFAFGQTLKETQLTGSLEKSVANLKVGEFWAVAVVVVGKA